MSADLSRDMLLLLQYSLSIEDGKIICSRHADLFVHLFPRAVRSEVLPPKVRKFQHIITIFSLTNEGVSLFT